MRDMLLQMCRRFSASETRDPSIYHRRMNCIEKEMYRALEKYSFTFPL